MKWIIWHMSQLNEFINEHCEIWDTFNIGVNRNITFMDILDYNGFKYVLFKDGSLEISK